MNEFGQMNESSERWKLIQKTILGNDFDTIVEIGTWKGMGSTLSVLKSKKDNTEFISLESNKDFFDIAKKNLKPFEKNFKLIYGRIVDVDEVMDFVSDFNLNTEQKNWLNEDIKNFNNCPNVLENIPEKIDFLILDGGEFSTYKEWYKLKDRTKIVALDDINVLKCERIYNELKEDSNYKMIEITQEGNGFCIFLKK